MPQSATGISVNVYSQSEHSDPESLELERRALEIEQLRTALTTRTTTAQATGLLAARFQLPTDRAWELLTQASSLSNVKLARLARIVVDIHDDVPLTSDNRQVAVALAAVFEAAVARVLTHGSAA